MARTLGAHHPDLTAVRDLHTKKGRDLQRRYLVEGETMLAEALDAGAAVVAVYATAEAYEKSNALRTSDDLDCRLVAAPVLARLSSLETPPGIVAVVARRPCDPHAVARNDRLLFLAGLNDPGNAGTLLRTAEAFGVQGVLMLAGGADPYSPKVVRASMGAIFRLEIAIVDAAATPDLLASHALVGTAVDGTSIDDFDFPERCAIAVGHERRGLAAGLPPPRATVAIPHAGRTESLNAAVAGGIVLYCLARQERLSRLG